MAPRGVVVAPSAGRAVIGIVPVTIAPAVTVAAVVSITIAPALAVGARIITVVGVIAGHGRLVFSEAKRSMILSDAGYQRSN